MKIDRKVFKAAIKKACPNIQFETQDSLGTKMSTWQFHVRVYPEELPALEVVCKDFGTKTVWPICSEIYGMKVRDINLEPE